MSLPFSCLTCSILLSLIYHDYKTQHIWFSFHTILFLASYISWTKTLTSNTGMKSVICIVSSHTHYLCSQCKASRNMKSFFLELRREISSRCMSKFNLRTPEIPGSWRHLSIIRHGLGVPKQQIIRAMSIKLSLV